MPCTMWRRRTHQHLMTANAFCSIPVSTCTSLDSIVLRVFFYGITHFMTIVCCHILRSATAVCTFRERATCGPEVDRHTDVFCVDVHRWRRALLQARYLVWCVVSHFIGERLFGEARERACVCVCHLFVCLLCVCLLCVWRACYLYNGVCFGNNMNVLFSKMSVSFSAYPVCFTFEGGMEDGTGSYQS